MKLYLIVLIICIYILNQVAIEARSTQLRKLYWPNTNNHFDQGDSFNQNVDHRRQAGQFILQYSFKTLFLFSNIGWGKRRYIAMDEDTDDYLLYHQYVPNEYVFHTGFDDK